MKHLSYIYLATKACSMRLEIPLRGIIWWMWLAHTHTHTQDTAYTQTRNLIPLSLCLFPKPHIWARYNLHSLLFVSTLISFLSKWLRYCVFFLCYMYLICIDYNGNPLLVFSNSLLFFSLWKLEFDGAEGDLEGLDHDRWENKAESNRSCSWYTWYLIFMSMFSLTVFHILKKSSCKKPFKFFGHFFKRHNIIQWFFF